MASTTLVLSPQLQQHHCHQQNVNDLARLFNDMIVEQLRSKLQTASQPDDHNHYSITPHTAGY